MRFSEKLKTLRKQHNITQTQLAEKLYVSRSLVARWEFGDIYPTLDNLNKISIFFDIQLGDLLCDDEKTEIIVNHAVLLKKIKKVLQIVINSVNVLIILFIISVFCPFMPIWGYKHELITSYDPLLKIDVCENTLFNVLNDNYYCSILKSMYVIILILEIFAILLSLISILNSCINKKNKINLLLFFINCFMNVILSILIVICFF